MILPAQAIRAITPAIVTPFAERGVFEGMSYGLSVAGYDIRVDQDLTLIPGAFRLASSVERFKMPLDLVAEVKDKSSWARQGLSVFNTIIESGWEGWLTLELKNQHDCRDLVIRAGMPIAQVIFYRTESPVEAGYSGKYQHQERGPQKARYET